MKQIHILLLVLTLGTACNEPVEPSVAKDTGSTPARVTTRSDSTVSRTAAVDRTDSAAQISQYVRCIFQDRAGNLWFGTTTDGVVRYDGRSLVHFTPTDGLSGNWVNAIAQDEHGDLWFATGGGVSRYDGRTFTRYTTKDGLAHDQVWSLLHDRNGGWWFGTEDGVSRYNGRTFTSFPIPAADLSDHPYYQNPKLIRTIIEDGAGNIWFGSNGGGAYRYDGRTLTNLGKKDGLCDDFVLSMLEDRDGNMWFGTRFGGLCKYEGTSPGASGHGRFATFTRKDLKGDNISTLYQDRDGIIWIGVNAIGLCSYDGTRFACYGEQDGAGIRVIMSVLQDTSGQLWFGTGAGVYRFDGTRFSNFTKEDIARLAVERGASVFRAVPAEAN